MKKFDLQGKIQSNLWLDFCLPVVFASKVTDDKIMLVSKIIYSFSINILRISQLRLCGARETL